MDSRYKISLYHKEYNFSVFVQMKREDGNPPKDLDDLEQSLSMICSLANKFTDILDGKKVDLEKDPIIALTFTDYPDEDNRTMFTIIKCYRDEDLRYHFDTLFLYLLYHKNNTVKLIYRYENVKFVKDIPKYIELINEYTNDEFIKQITSTKEIYDTISDTIINHSNITIATYENNKFYYGTWELIR